MRRWCVFEVRVDAGVLWAWCLSHPEVPGFDTVTFTEDDGATLVDVPDQFKLGAFLFSVPARPKEQDD